MARAWRRADRKLMCGADRACVIAQYAPYCILSGEGWQKLRCEKHAPEAAPADIDQPQAKAAVTVPSFTRVREVAADWQKRAAGDSDSCGGTGSSEVLPQEPR